ncbi:hypothetical protein GGTG_03232 [Gaeumannomyces tritici R3-111a-1]|uniref:Rhodopsin domain-containing protein n=1 Tax=Gaeumannomyces tritici (strain R3-111a-1) TaxID=644352 RepID=J3NPM5_GAET3|nr:hypothetical protein GGTG_03232 [Gaeumannomyces tritici R3-111a-1]EJT78130.1 hypothetical protein GGTG_03232 [Gaeumannomyces tritici R3-111a-1]
MAKGVSTMHAGEDWGPSLIAVTVIMLVLSVVAVSARIYTSLVLIKRFVIEDALAILSTIVYFVFTVFCCIGVSWGLGKKTTDVPNRLHHKALLYKYLGMAAYIAVSGLIKFVVGIYLIRLFKNSRQKWQTYFLIVLLVLVGISNTAYFFISIFQCTPIWVFWHQKDDDFTMQRNCFKPAIALGSTYTVNLINIVADLALALLPISLVWKSQLDRRTKISVVAILAVGSASSLATIVRVPYLYQLLDNPEYLANFVELANWSAVEIGLAIVASSAATLRPLFRKLKVFTSTMHSRNRYGTGYSQGSRGGKSTFHSRSRSFGFQKGSGSKDLVTGGAGTMFSASDVKGPITVDTSISVDIEKCAAPVAPEAGGGGRAVAWRDTADMPPLRHQMTRHGSQESLAGSFRMQRQGMWEEADVEGGHGRVNVTRVNHNHNDNDAATYHSRSSSMQMDDCGSPRGRTMSPRRFAPPRPLYGSGRAQRVRSLPTLAQYESSTELPYLSSPSTPSPVTPALPAPSPYPLSSASSSSIPSPISPLPGTALSTDYLPPPPPPTHPGSGSRANTPFI